MKSTGLSRSSLVGSPRGRFVVLFLVGVLILCHGIFGALHLCSAAQGSGDYAEYKHQASPGAGAHGQDHLACHLTPSTDYYAVVILTAFLGLVLGLLIKGTRSWVGVIAPLIVGRRFTPIVLPPPQGPTTLPVLQVFRL